MGMVAVQVHHVQPLGAGLLPPAAHGGRVVPEHGFLVRPSLPKPHTLAAANVNGWKDYHHIRL